MSLLTSETFSASLWSKDKTQMPTLFPLYSFLICHKTTFPNSSPRIFFHLPTFHLPVLYQSLWLSCLCSCSVNPECHPHQPELLKFYLFFKIHFKCHLDFHKDPDPSVTIKQTFLELLNSLQCYQITSLLFIVSSANSFAFSPLDDTRLRWGCLIYLFRHLHFLPQALSKVFYA